MMKTGLYVAALSVLMTTTAIAADKADLSTSNAKISYAIGLQIGDSLVSEGIPLDQAALTAAIADSVAGRDPQLSDDDVKQALIDFQKQKVAVLEQAAKKSQAAGAAYLADNKKKDGVTVTDSGLQYKVLTHGDGKSPSPTDMVTVHYRGTLLNGEEFDSSYSRGEPATFPVNGVIQGWQEVLPMMKVGDKFQVAIPSELAYGERGTGHGIGPNETLLFDIELLDVKTSPHAAGGTGAGHAHAANSMGAGHPH